MELILICYLTGLLSSLLLGRATWKEKSLPWRIAYAVLAAANMLLVLAMTAFVIIFHDAS
jgi:hypothetical protein